MEPSPKATLWSSIAVAPEPRAMLSEPLAKELEPMAI